VDKNWLIFETLAQIMSVVEPWQFEKRRVNKQRFPFISGFFRSVKSLLAVALLDFSKLLRGPLSVAVVFIFALIISFFFLLARD
jgi:hypothetical protein